MVDALEVISEARIVAALPKFNDPRRNWSGKCEAAIWNLFDQIGDGGPSSPSATVARKRSKIEGSGWGPGNNVVWWSGVWGYENGRQVDFGHVAFHLGDGWAFMASSHVTTKIPGFTNIGFVDLARYEKAFPNMRREGWSWDHAGAVLPTIIDTSEEDEFMTISVPIFDERGEVIDHQPAHMVLAEMLLHSRNNTPAAVRDQAFPSTVLKQADGSPQPVTLGILADHTRVIIGQQSAQIAALTAAVTVLAESAGINADELATLISKRVDDALADNFEAIPAQLAAALAN